MTTSCSCFIVPSSVLDRFAKDKKLSAGSRRAFADTQQLEVSWRKLRSAHNDAVQSRLLVQPAVAALVSAPAVTVFDCKHTTSLPGLPVPNPGASADATAKRAFQSTQSVAKFYKQCFGRNSIDNAGMTLMSSIHYGTAYNNAFWNGSQMTYGDGDSQIFIDFTRSDDVIGHELTHGVTQHTAGLGYANQPGALNESVSDVFGSMFRQWLAGDTAASADWLIGSAIMGPAAIARGYKCLRDLAKPGAQHCLSPQPSNMSGYVPGGDPHENSGIPNFAFYSVAASIGGKSWDVAGKIWYAALTSPLAKPTLTFKGFKRLTKVAAKLLFPTKPAVYAAVVAGWKAAGV